MCYLLEWEKGNGSAIRRTLYSLTLWFALKFIYILILKQGLQDDMDGFAIHFTDFATAHLLAILKVKWVKYGSKTGSLCVPS